jgi:hypothetical protein
MDKHYYILKFYGRDELCQMKISTDIEKLKKQAKEEVDGVSFRKIVGHESLYFLYDGEYEIGVIGFIEDLK